MKVRVRMLMNVGSTTGSARIAAHNRPEGIYEGWFLCDAMPFECVWRKGTERVLDQTSAGEFVAHIGLTGPIVFRFPPGVIEVLGPAEAKHRLIPWGKPLATCGDVFEGRSPDTGRKQFRTYLDEDLGGSVWFRRGQGCRRRQPREKCTLAEWEVFMGRPVRPPRAGGA